MFGHLLGRQNSSKAVAKERLRLVLVHDRSHASPQLLENMKNEIFTVISRYLDIDQEGLDVSFTQNERQVALVANIPVKQVKRAWDQSVDQF